MKKIVTLLLVLCLTAVAFAPAFAETAEAEKKVINWDADYQQKFADAGYAGEFKTFEPSNLSVIIPNDFQQGSLTEESTASGTIAAFLKADKTMIAIAQSKPTGGITLNNIDEVAAMALQTDPNGNFQRVVVNGLEALIYITEKDTCTIMTLLDNGELFTVTCTNFAANKDLFSFVAASLQLKK